MASIYMPNPIDYNEITEVRENDLELINLTNNPQAVLLGFRVAYKDLQSSSVELIYGPTISLSGEFFNSSPVDSSPIQLVGNLMLFRFHQTISSFKPLQKVSVCPTALKGCSHVFIRNDTMRKPLKAPYAGLLKVVHRTDKAFDVEIHGRMLTISFDRLEPAFLESESVQPSVVTKTVQSDMPCTPVIMKTKTRYGRTVRFPRDIW
ncbi:pol polyprotein [Trichonephila clavata]|uniref:Pol polyprotein n=1 Tax=Trichonephila clavata TaxID=2740835 RepID=A0A8X6M182_TRICU|nr:pol polyprotein [Trichonephila clavata]